MRKNINDLKFILRTLRIKPKVILDQTLHSRANRTDEILIQIHLSRMLIKVKLKRKLTS